MALAKQLLSLSAVMIRQRRELAEFIGFETRNKYSIEDEAGAQIGFAAEQSKSLFGFLFRQVFGHWRSFDLHIFSADRQLECVARHPFRFFFQEISIIEPGGRELGKIVRRFSIFSKRFDLLDANGGEVLSVSSPLWRIWTFAFMRNGEKRALVQKKWGGLLKEGFLDADTFRVEFLAAGMPAEERLLVVIAGVFIDLLYFEEKASR